MKIKIIIASLFFFSTTVFSNLIDNSNQINLLPIGKANIINKSVVKLINDNCRINSYFDYTENDWKEYDKRCVLSTFSSTLNFDNILKEIEKSKSVYIFRSNTFNLYLKKTVDTFNYGNYVSKSKQAFIDLEENEAPNQFDITLFVESSNKIINKLVIYSNKDYGSDLAQITLDFYIDAKLNIWLLEYAFDEEGASTRLWQHYQLNNRGKLDLLDVIKCHYKNGITLLCNS
jgi:hypothetical protein